ncbi:MAG TPA: vanadium-dependent haloperoxidase, partial [Lapillicoccus sp.]|nr:vanadium-dependent haloperoxidase [Lapillicoccus sp.]
AQFFSANPVPVYRSAVCTLLENEPMGLLPTTRFFARVDAAMAMSFIAAWRLKFDIGYWRPFQAIAAAATDNNPGTLPHPGPAPWTPLVQNPAYADYPSGHAQATSAFAQVLRKTLGDDTALVLTSGGMTRPYATLTELEHDAFHARIWGGLHFRDAMDDGYFLGHTTADRVMTAVR